MIDDGSVPAGVILTTHGKTVHVPRSTGITWGLLLFVCLFWGRGENVREKGKCGKVKKKCWFKFHVFFRWVAAGAVPIVVVKDARNIKPNSRV